MEVLLKLVLINRDIRSDASAVNGSSLDEIVVKGRKNGKLSSNTEKKKEKFKYYSVFNPWRQKKRKGITALTEMCVLGTLCAPSH